MSTESTQKWLEVLGYNAFPVGLHRRVDDVSEKHPYALELKTLLRLDGPIRARTVFDVDGMPTVVFVGKDGDPLSSQALDKIRKCIWNQSNYSGAPYAPVYPRRHEGCDKLS